MSHSLQVLAECRALRGRQAPPYSACLNPTHTHTKGMQFYSYKEDWRRVARTYSKAIALWPDAPSAYYNLGVVLSNSGRSVEAAQRFLEAMERFPVGSPGLGRCHGKGLQLAAAEGVRRGGQAGVVERRGAQGAVGEGREGGAEPGVFAERAVWRLGGGASLGSGAQAGDHAFQSVYGAIQGSRRESRAGPGERTSAAVGP